jgi:DNA-binding MarR family transcriptional regulator
MRVIMKSKKYIYKDLIELTDLLYLVGEAISKNGKEIIFKPSNLTIPRYSILRELSECKDKRLPAASLQKTLKVTSGNITGRLNGLEDMGLIKRVVGKDKRTASWHV